MTNGGLHTNRLSGLVLRAAATVLACGLLLATPLAAQTARDPIQCWWKADKNALEVGEHLTLMLTCGVGARIVPKMEDLDPGAVQFAPFEVISGTRHEDIQAPPWRYFQYEYTLRLVGEDFFGKDVQIPALTVTYNVQSDVAGAPGGRDQMYVMPAMPIRILSLVPREANDIRDSTGESFAIAQSRLSRATAEFIAAGILFGFGALMFAFAAVRAIRGNRGQGPVPAPVLGERALLRACLQEIGRLESEVARGSWTPERAGSALTIFRIGGAVAMGRPVAQAPLDGAMPVREGQLAVRRGLFTRARIVVSAPVTSHAIERYRANSNGNLANGRSALLDALGKSLFTFSAVRYGRSGNTDFLNLNLALEDGRSMLRRLHVTTLWPVRVAEKLAQSASAARSSMWTR